MTELDSLATALYVKTDDLLKDSPQLAPWRPAAGTAPKLGDAELVTLAMMQAMLGFTSEARWLRHARASRSRYFWGLRLHLVCTLHGLPIAFALTGAKADERETLPDLLALEPQLVADRPGQTLIGDKNYFGREFEQQLADQDIWLLRPARKGEAERAGSQLFKPLRQVIESVNETFKGQLDLERHRGRTPGGVAVRVLQRILALTAAIWHNDHTGQPVMRALTAYDH
jgi:hypothetical protein